MAKGPSKAPAPTSYSTVWRHKNGIIPDSWFENEPGPRSGLSTFLSPSELAWHEANIKRIAGQAEELHKKQVELRQSRSACRCAILDNDFGGA